MSKYVVAKVGQSVTNTDMLVRALQSLTNGGAVEVAQGGQMFAISESYASDVAEVVVRKATLKRLPGADIEGDLGFRRDPAGVYQSVFSDWCAPATRRLLAALPQAYATETVLAYAAAQGYAIQQEQDANGVVTIVVGRY